MIHTIVQCVLFFFAVYCYRAWLNRRTWQLLQRLPGPVNLPFIGSIYLIPGMDTTRYLRLLVELTRTYGSPYCFWLGPMPVVIVSTANHARAILTSPVTMEKSSIYKFIPLRGIFSLPVPKWRTHRKVIQPTFNLSILQSFIPLFEQKADTMVQHLSAKVVQQQPFDIYQFTTRCTLDMVFATTLGMDMHIQDTPKCRYLEVLEELFEIVTVRVMNVFLHPEWLYRYTSVYRKEVKDLEEFFRPSKQLLADERLGKRDNQRKHESEKTKSNSLIEQLKSSMLGDTETTNEAIEQELNTIIFAGNETSATAVANTLLLIAMYPAVQDKLVDEIRANFGNNVTSVCYETLSKLVYMEVVLKESLRLLPIAPIVGRRTTAEIDLAGYRLPAGVDIGINIFDIHRNPAYWGADADQFRPERFESNSYDGFSFLPFSAGPRNCVGLRYAWISMKIILLKVLARYTIETDLKLEDLKMKIAMTMKLMGGQMVTLKNRM